MKGSYCPIGGQRAIGSMHFLPGSIWRCLALLQQMIRRSLKRSNLDNSKRKSWTMPYAEFFVSCSDRWNSGMPAQSSNDLIVNHIIAGRFRRWDTLFRPGADVPERLLKNAPIVDEKRIVRRNMVCIVVIPDSEVIVEAVAGGNLHALAVPVAVPWIRVDIEQIGNGNDFAINRASVSTMFLHA